MILHTTEHLTCHNGHTWEAGITTVDNDYYHEPEITYDDGEDEAHRCPECGELSTERYGKLDEVALGKRLNEILSSNQPLAYIAEDLCRWDVSELTSGFFGMTQDQDGACYEAMVTLRDMIGCIAAIKSKRLKELVA